MPRCGEFFDLADVVAADPTQDLGRVLADPRRVAVDGERLLVDLDRIALHDRPVDLLKSVRPEFTVARQHAEPVGDLRRAQPKSSEERDCIPRNAESDLAFQENPQRIGAGQVREGRREASDISGNDGHRDPVAGRRRENQSCSQ